MSKYIVYLRTNTVNGKQYVGQTNNFRKRENNWNSLKERYSNIILQNDREKYGLENFNTKILAEVDTQKEAWYFEKKFIKEYDTKYPNGYNMSDGGKTNAGRYVTDEIRENMSEAQKGKHNGEKNPMYGKPRPEDAGTPPKPIKVLKNDELVAIYPCINEAAKDLNLSRGNIYGCLKGVRKHTKGYTFELV